MANSRIYSNWKFIGVVITTIGSIIIGLSGVNPLIAGLIGIGGIVVMVSSYLFEQKTLDKNEERDNVRKEIKNNTSEILDKIASNENLQEEVSRYVELIDEHQKIQIEEIDKLIESYEYEKAIEKLHKLRNLFEDKANDNKPFGLVIFNKLGFCHERVEQTTEANQFYIRALALEPNSPNLIRKGVIAYDRQGNSSERDRLIKKLNDKFPDNRSTFIVNLSKINTEEELDKFVEKMNNSIDISTDVELLISIANAYKSLNCDSKNLSYLKRSIDIAKTDILPFLEAILAHNLSHKFLKNLGLLEIVNVSNDEKEQIREAILFYEKSWNTFKDTSQKHLQSRTLINLAGLYVLLDNTKYAIELIKEAINAAPPKLYYEYLMRLIGFLHLENNIHEIIEIVRHHDWNKIEEYHDMVTIYLIALSTSEIESNVNELVKIANEFITNNKKSFQFDTILTILVINLIKLDQLTEVEKLLNNLKIEFPEKDKLKLLESKFLRNKNELKKAQKILEPLTNEYINKAKTDRLLLIELLEENLFNEKYDLVIQLFESCIDIEKTFHEDSLSIYTDACIKLDRKDKVLRLSEKIRIFYGIHPKHIKNEVAICYENRNYKKALELSESYLAKYPNDVNFKIFYCDLLLTSDNLDIARQQTFNIDYQTLSIRSLKGLIKVYFVLNEKEKLFGLLYEIWRVQRSAEVCEVITLAITQTPISSDELRVEVVNENCVVYLENEFGKEEYCIFSSREQTLPRLREYNLERDFKELRGKKVGDTILFGINQITQQPFKKRISKILTIHQFIFFDSRDALTSEYQGQTSITALNFKSAEEGAKFIFDSLHTENRINEYQKRVERDNQDLDKYVTGNLPFGIIATTLQVSPIALWYSFTANSKIGIFNNYPLNKDSSQETLNNVISGICCDITTLLTIFKLDLGDLFIEKFGKIVVAQSILDLIKENNINEFHIGMSNIQIPYQDNFNKIRHSFINQEKEEFLQDLPKFLAWVKKYCTIEVASERLKVPNKKQEVYSDVLNDSTYDTLLIAKEKGYVFFSEDYYTRLASTAFELKYLWVAPTLFHFRKNVTTSGEFNLMTRALVNLHKLNYKTLRVDAYQLIEVVNDKSLFIKLTHLMNNNLLAEDYRTKQFLLFLKLLWESSVKNKQDITFIFLTHFVAVDPGGFQANSFKKYIVSNLEKELDRTQFTLLSSVVSNWATKVPNIKSKVQKEVSFDKFKSLDIRVGTIVNIKELPNKFSKSYILTVDIGFEKRTIVCEIKEFYKVEELLNTKVSVIVNLPQRIIGGITSHGVVLKSMNDEGKVSLIRPKGGYNGSVIH